MSEPLGIVAAVTNADEGCVLALNLAGGTAYCAVAASPERLIDDPLVVQEMPEFA